MRFLFLLLLLASCSYFIEEATIDGSINETAAQEAALPIGATTCGEVPEFCQEVGVRVCGSDGETYLTACHACTAGLDWYLEGPCPTERSTSCDDAGACEKQYDPVCGSDGETYSNRCAACESGVAWFEKGTCSESGYITCTGERPHGCPVTIDPVCGTIDTGIRCIRAPCPSSKQATYQNSCEACADVRVLGYEKGACA